MRAAIEVVATTRLGELAQQHGLATEDQVNEAVETQYRLRRTGIRKRLGLILVEEGILSNDEVLSLLAKQNKTVLACLGCGTQWNVKGHDSAQTYLCGSCGSPLAQPEGDRNCRVAGTSEIVRVGGDDSEEFTAEFEEMGGEQRPASEADFVPGYRLDRMIGRGPTGAIFRAVEEEGGRDVAVRILRPDLGTDSHFIRRFLAEARAAAKVRHPNVISILACVALKDRYFVVMEYMRGLPLDTVLAKRGKLRESTSLKIVGQVASGLEFARKRGIHHYDVRPHNIMVTRNGTAKLRNLGLTRRPTHSGAYSLDSLVYASPERVGAGGTPDTRSDVYSLGVTLFELTTGTLPFKAGKAEDMLAKHAWEIPDPPIARNPALSVETNDLIVSMIMKDPELRPRTPGEVALKVNEILKPGPAAPEVNKGTTRRITGKKDTRFRRR
ncbi:MAG: serine/threonine-protein kinase [Planctomycetota bacterium]|jgi:predicted Ser/Thr protein kinase